MLAKNRCGPTGRLTEDEKNAFRVLGTLTAKQHVARWNRTVGTIAPALLAIVVALIIWERIPLARARAQERQHARERQTGVIEHEPGPE